MSFWVGGTGNYSDAANHWAATSGGAPGAGNLPTSTKDAVFDTNSHTTNYTVTFDTTVTCQDLTIGAPAAGNVTLTMSTNRDFDVYGSISVYASAVVTSFSIATLTLRATTTGKTLAMSKFTNNVVTGLTFNGVGGGWTFTQAISSAAPAVRVTAGTVDFSTFTYQFRGLLSTGALTRVINMGSASFTGTGIGGDGFDFSGSGLTFNAGTSHLKLGSTALNFIGNGLTFYDVTLNSTGASTITGANTFHDVLFNGAGNCAITGSNTFNKLTRNGTAVKTDKLNITSGTTQTVTDTFTIAGNSPTNRVLVQSSINGSQATISAATVTVSNADFQDISGTGAGSWNFAASAAVGDCGGNTGITGTTAADQFFQSGASANWSTAGNWYLATNGGGGAGRVPLPQDTAKLDANSFTAGSIVLTQDMPRIGPVNFTGTTNTPDWALSTACSFFGSLTLVSGMTLSGTALLTYEGRGASTLTSAGKAFSNSLTVDAPGGSLTIQDAFSTSSASTITVDRGTFDHNNFAVTGGKYDSDSGFTRAVTWGTADITITGSSATILSFSPSTGLTLTLGTGVIKCTYSGGAGTRTVLTSTTLRVAPVEVTAGSDTFSINRLLCSGFDMTGWSGTLAGAGDLDVTTNGVTRSATEASRTYTGFVNLGAVSGTKLLTSNGKTWASQFLFATPAGNTWQLADALTTTGIIRLGTGTFDTNGLAITSGPLTFNGSGTRALIMGANTWTITGTGTVLDFTPNTGFSFTKGTSTFKFTNASASAKTIAGGAQTFYDFWIDSGAGTGSWTFLNNNTFRDFRDSGTAAHSLLFTATSTNTFSSWTGFTGNLVTIGSPTAANHNLVKAGGGVVAAQLAAVSRSQATPNTFTWYAGSGAVNGGNNTGWIFSDAPSGNFFLMF